MMSNYTRCGLFDAYISLKSFFIYFDYIWCIRLHFACLSAHKVALLHEKVRHQRADWLHKESRHLINDYDFIGIEDLNMKDMSQTLHFGKSVSDNGWGMFKNMLIYKAEMAGKQIIQVDKLFPSSQMCSQCGYINKDTKDLSIREWTCPKCGTHHNRDHNAAKNLKTEALRIALL